MSFGVTDHSEFFVSDDDKFIVTADRGFYRPAERVWFKRFYADTVFVREPTDQYIPRLR